MVDITTKSQNLSNNMYVESTGSMIVCTTIVTYCHTLFQDSNLSLGDGQGSPSAVIATFRNNTQVCPCEISQ